MLRWRSIRFRLSVQYSAVVFGLGGALLGVVYLAIQRHLKEQTMTEHFIIGQRVFLEDGRSVIIPALRELEIRAIETVFNELVLNQVARFTVIALVALFLISLVVGWVMSGRVLKPVGEITDVAREIEASDLSRRIDLQGPDDELTRLADTFDAMLERLDRAFTTQRRFLADTSHDLRTPLAVIRSNVELVADDPGAGIADWRKAGEVIRRNVVKMTEMIDGLLTTARLQTGRAQAVTLDLADLVSTKATEFESIGTEVTVETVASTALVEGVEVALDRALTNLLDNAGKVAPSGSTIRLGAGTVDGWAWMAVQDEGPGMRPDHPGDQIGLGLSIVTQIAEEHRGVLASYPGREGNGTTMVVWIPTDGAQEPHPSTSPLPI